MPSSFSSTLTLLRPKQWVKNGFVLTPLCFSLQFSDVNALTQALLAMVVFILLSSIVYIFNDMMDLAEDKLHPKKCMRPLASGKISLKSAYLLCSLLLVSASFITLFLPQECYIVMAGYLLFNFFYSIKLKKIAIIDVLIIASGFILRVLMGGFATGISVSPWIIMTTFLLALFLGFGKRHQELSSLSSTNTRSSLDDYSLPLLDKLITISCSATLLSYAIYVVEIAHRTGKTALVYTIFFVVFGLFRYLQALYVYDKGEEPEAILFRDGLFLANIIAWLGVTLWILAH